MAKPSSLAREQSDGKRTGRVNELKATYELDQQLIHPAPRAGGTPETFHLHADKAGLEAYVSDFFGMPVHLLHNEQGRLLDIPDESSVTVVSIENLVSLWQRVGKHTGGYTPGLAFDCCLKQDSDWPNRLRFHQDITEKSLQAAKKRLQSLPVPLAARSSARDGKGTPAPGPGLTATNAAALAQLA